MLFTQWGDYNLENLSRIDIYFAPHKGLYECYICLDSFKHLLYAFQSEKDAHRFSRSMREVIRDKMFEIDPGDYMSIDLNTEINKQLDKLMR